jgi:hypothetical protein
MEAMMGQAKHEMEVASENWKRVGAKCAVCAQPVPVEEKESYYETGMCGYCRHVSEKDD